MDYSSLWIFKVDIYHNLKLKEKNYCSSHLYLN